MQQMSYRMPRLFTYRKHVFKKVEDIYRRPVNRRTRRTQAKRIPVTYPIEVTEKIETKDAPALSPYMVDESLLDKTVSAGQATGMLINGPAPVYQYSRLTSTSRFKPLPITLVRDRLHQARVKMTGIIISLSAIMQRFFGDMRMASSKLKTDSFRTFKQLVPVQKLPVASFADALDKTKSWSIAAVPIIVIALLGMHVIDRPATKPQSTPALPKSASASDRRVSSNGGETSQTNQQTDTTSDGQSRNSSTTTQSTSSSGHNKSSAVGTSWAASPTSPAATSDSNTTSTSQTGVGGFGGGMTTPDTTAAPVPSESNDPPEDDDADTASEKPTRIVIIPGHSVEIDDNELLQTPDIAL